ncbi:MAG: N-6 DNA methylase [Methylococcaceae bacterium]
MKKSNRYSSSEGKEVWNQLEIIHSLGHSLSTVFSDWLDLMLNALLSMNDNMRRGNQLGQFDGQYEDRYMAIIKRYNNDRPRGKRPADYFANAWVLLYKETAEKEKDTLGTIYEERITFGENGQFFTPAHIADAMAKMIIKGSLKPNQTVCDPCCGSGRMLLSAAKECPEAIFYGTDIDNRCAKMAVINMFLFDLNADIYWGNTLTMEFWKRWVIRKGGYVVELECKEEEGQQEHRPIPKAGSFQLELTL